MPEGAMWVIARVELPHLCCVRYFLSASEEGLTGPPGQMFGQHIISSAIEKD